MKLSPFFAPLLCCCLLQACDSPSSQDPAENNRPLQSTQNTVSSGDTKESASIEDIISSGANFQTLATITQAVGLVEQLDKENNLTLLAPNNDAFMALGESKLEELLDPAKQSTLKKILLNHIIKGRLELSNLQDGQKLNTLGDKSLQVKITGGQVQIGNATIVAPDIQAKNGVIHALDQVLLP
jgi:uncharacterized surface protein with fasciclin (FAS1) repeats